MSTVNHAILLTCALFPLCSCKPDAGPAAEPDEPEAVANSHRLATEFPLLPIIEGPLWQKLLNAESAALDSEATKKLRSDATVEAGRITERLQQKHPFQREGSRSILGGIVHDKDTGKIEIPAIVCYPEEGDNRHPGELELILCSVSGRSHETLFTTDVRPLHLELLMHLAGYGKSPPASTFRVEVVIADHDAIPIESLIRSTGNDPLPERLLWEFSGSEFKDPYQPDMTGDFLICWHAHDSVLRVRHEKISSGEIKLKPAPHPELKQNQAVTLVLTPE